MLSRVRPGTVVRCGVMKVGSLEIHPVYDGTFRQAAADILRYGGTAEDPFAAHAEFVIDGMIEFALGGFVLQLGDRTVVIDCGLGPMKTDGGMEGGQFLASLDALGVQPSDVTDVLFTHLHFDHVGWATQKGVVVFPNATYRCHRADWAHFVDDPAGGAARKMAPVADRMEFWESDTTIFPGLDVQGAPGHTPGSTIMVVSHGKDRAMLLGDVVHCPLELVEDDWQAVFDVDPVLAQRTRAAVARELEGTNTAIAAAHFPGLQFGRLLETGGKRSWAY